MTFLYFTYSCINEAYKCENDLPIQNESGHINLSQLVDSMLCTSTYYDSQYKHEYDKTNLENERSNTSEVKSHFSSQSDQITMLGQMNEIDYISAAHIFLLPVYTFLFVSSVTRHYTAGFDTETSQASQNFGAVATTTFSFAVKVSL